MCPLRAEPPAALLDEPFLNILKPNWIQKVGKTD
jgi:hypothetical protein